jgi:diphthamide biosynthesis methyltransferase
MKELAAMDFGTPLHSLIIVGEMHYLEDELLNGLSHDNIQSDSKEAES